MYVEEVDRCGCTATMTCCRFGLAVVCTVLAALCTALETKPDTKLDTNENSALVPDPNPVFPEPDTVFLRVLPAEKLARENWLVNDPALLEVICVVGTEALPIFGAAVDTGAVGGAPCVALASVPCCAGAEPEP